MKTKDSVLDVQIIVLSLHKAAFILPSPPLTIKLRPFVK